MSTDRTGGENGKKRHGMHFTGPGLPSEPGDGNCWEDGEGADTIATKIRT